MGLAQQLEKAGVSPVAPRKDPDIVRLEGEIIALRAELRAHVTKCDGIRDSHETSRKIVTRKPMSAAERQRKARERKKANG